MRALGVERAARLLVEQTDLGAPPFERIDRLRRFLGALESALRYLRIDRSAGDLLQQLRALLRVGAQKGVEIALREHDGAAELIEGETGKLDNSLVDRFDAGLDHSDNRARLIDPKQAAPAILQIAGRLAARAGEFPARPVTLSVARDEIRFGESTRRAASQDRARIVGGDVFSRGVGDVLLGAWRGDARKFVVERKAQRIENRRFAGAGFAGDGEEAGPAQRLRFEIDLETLGEAREIFASDRQNAQAHSSRAILSNRRRCSLVGATRCARS